MPKPLPSQEYLRECFDYNANTGSLTWRVRPLSHFKSRSSMLRANKLFAGHTAGTPVKKKGWNGTYIRVTMNGRWIKAHRIVWKWVTGNEPPEEIDHRDRIGTNNCWTNLRASTRLQNMRNTGLYARRVDLNKNLPKGVHPNGSGYTALIRCNYKSINLGTFNTAAEAHAAYIGANKVLHQLTTLVN